MSTKRLPDPLITNLTKIKFKIIFFLMLFLVIFGLAKTSQGTTRAAASCSYADILAAYTSASAGDTVSIPAGTCTWGASDHLNITKQISIIGAGTTSGSKVTKIIHDVLDDDDSVTPATFNISVTSDVPVRISGIYFDKVTNISGSTYPNIYREAIHISGSGNNGFALTQIRIDHNLFNRGCPSIFSHGYVYGVVDSNTFLNPNIAIYIVGDNTYAWDRPIAAGTRNAFFIEGNSFILDNNFGIGSSNEMIYPQEGARVVVRYNTYDASLYSRNDTPPFCTSHPNWGGIAPYYEEYRGQPIYEVYNNVVSLTSSYNTMTGFRGGSVIIHDNTITKSNPNTSEFIAGFTEEEGWTYGGPWCPNCPKITKWPANDQIINSFIWNNYINGSLNNNIYLGETTSL